VYLLKAITYQIHNLKNEKKTTKKRATFEHNRVLLCDQDLIGLLSWWFVWTDEFAY